MTEVDSYPAMDNPNHDFYVVGIGASAGGLEALEKLFDALPADSGFAFVIVQHLSPDFKSLMSELLSRHTSMKVCQASDGMPVEPDHLYLMPPDQIVRMRGRHLECTPKPKPKTLSLPIDDFLTSLATDIGDKAIAVVLSGTGSDGSRGIARVHDAGGLVIVQSIESAKFDGMPRNAIDTHCVDAVAPPDQIAAMLMRYAAQPNRSRIASPPVSESSLQTVFRLLNERHRIDFQDYKPNTITRRIERRVQLMHDEHLSHYAARLDSDPEEIDRLYRDLLIGVTQLFRDTEAFKCFRDEVLVDLLSRQPTGEEFRVWVSACATGEEAVSIAISINETMRDLNLSFPVKIFATDVHAASLRVAHAGLYPKSHLKGINRAIAKRYFRPLGEQIQISPDIRQMLVFAPHDLLKDAPFTRLHLVTCRNLLIYLQPPAQKRVLSVLHFGLLPGGVMFLGGSENTSSMSDYFEVVSERHRLYRKPQHFGGGEKPKLPEIRSWLGVNRSTLPPAPDDSVTHDAVSEAINRTEPAGYETRQPWTALYEELLGRYMPAALLVDSDLQVLHTFGGAGKFLRFIDGRVTANLEDMLDGDLLTAISGSIRQVIDHQETILFEQVDGPESRVRLEISPVASRLTASITNALVTLTDLEDDDLDDDRPAVPRRLQVEEASRIQMAAMRDELAHTKESLQATIEELETSNEELQATNEEMTASNEELQSTNEELQSVNEELYTVNAEYQAKIDELTTLTNDMDNLLVSTEVHTLFLDRNLRIRRFTPKMAALFHLLPQDLGRPISGFTHQIEHDDLMAVLNESLDNESPHEARVTDRDGAAFLMRILPYRAAGQTSGLVLTLIDIEGLVKAQEEAARQQDRFERAIAANRDGTWDWMDVSRDEMWWSPNCWHLLGFEPGEFPATHSKWLSLIHPDDRQRVMETSIPGTNKCFVRLHRDFEYRMCHRDGAYRWFRHRALVDEDENGRPTRMTGSVGDIHDRKMAEVRYVEEIQRRDHFLAMLSHELRNPMAAVLHAVELQTEVDGPAETQLLSDEHSIDTLAVMRRQTEHMARLLDDLLDIARFGQDKIVFRKQWWDLTASVGDAIDAVTPSISDKNQNLQVDVAQTLPEIWVDVTRLQQAQVNLLQNASKYTPEGGDIHFEIRQDADEIVISVTDNGVGIAADQLQNVFELFTQSESSLARSSGGMGVGLSLCRSIVEHHDGSIAAFSEGVGQGSCFVIRLPVSTKAEPVAETSSGSNAEGNGSHQADSGHGDSLVANLMVDSAHGNIPAPSMGRVAKRVPSHQIAASAEQRPSTASDNQPDVQPISSPATSASDVDATAEVNDSAVQTSLLLVEDNIDARDILGRVLTLRGFDVSVASDGIEALRRQEALRPDVCVVDIGLPGINGYQVASDIRARFPHQPGVWPPQPLLIALTGYGQSKDRERAIEAGFDAHVVKPVRPEKLIEIVRKLQDSPWSPEEN